MEVIWKDPGQKPRALGNFRIPGNLEADFQGILELPRALDFWVQAQNLRFGPFPGIPGIYGMGAGFGWFGQTLDGGDGFWWGDILERAF